MDYVPPERPAIVAQASDRLLADRQRTVFASAFGDVGMIDTLPETGEWIDTTTWEQRMLLTDLKPGQRVVFAKPRLAAKPLFYINQLQPCSPPIFAMFDKLIKADHFARLGASELEPLREILETKVTDKKFHTHAGQIDINGHHALMVNCFNTTNNTYSESIFIVANRKKRLIQEIGYEGATEGDAHWSKEAHEMLMNIELKSEK
jgi:hypothetical protein